MHLVCKGYTQLIQSSDCTACPTHGESVAVTTLLLIIVLALLCAVRCPPLLSFVTCDEDVLCGVAEG